MNPENDLLETVNKLFRESLELKSQAIKPKADFKLFQEAAEKLKLASLNLEALLRVESDFEEKIKSEVLVHYYRHEEADCMYAFYRQGNDLSSAQEKMDLALIEIEKALNIIKENYQKVNDSTKEVLSGWKKDWFYRKLVTDAKVLEPEAKLHSKNSNYVKALDTYKSILDKYELAKDYCLQNDLSAELKRISKGNYFGQSVNVSQMYAGLIITQQFDEKLASELIMDLLKHFVCSYEQSKNAFDENPEWIEYREGQKTIRENIERLLASSKDDWDKYLIEMENDPEITKIMKSSDIQAYKKAKAKTDIESNSLKKLYFTGIFWLIVLGVVFYIIFSIFDSSIPFIYQPIAAFLVIILFSVFGAFILRSSDGLSEENFLELMKLSLKLGFQGLKTLETKKTPHNN